MLDDLGQIWAESSENQRSRSYTLSKDSLITFVKTFMKGDQAKPKRLLAFLMPNRICIPQAHIITVVALHLGVFQGIVNILREALW